MIAFRFKKKLNTQFSLKYFLYATFAWCGGFIILWLYCYFHAFLSKKGEADLLFSLLWAFKVTYLWLVIIPFFFLCHNKLNKLVGENKKWWHWIFLISFFALLTFGVQILIWGNVSINEVSYLAYLYVPKSIVVLLVLSLVLNRFENSIQPEYHFSPQKNLLVSIGQSKKIIDCNCIDYVSASGNYIELHHQQSCSMMRSTMKAIMEKLDPQQFIRIHRKYIVNIKSVATIKRSENNNQVIFLKDGSQLPVGRQYQDSLKTLS